MFQQFWTSCGTCPNCMRRGLAGGCKHYFAFQAGTIRCLRPASMAIDPERLKRTKKKSLTSFAISDNGKGEILAPHRRIHAKQFNASERVGLMGRYALVGLAAGSLPLLVCGPLLMLGASSRSLPLATCLIINPLIGVGLGCLYQTDIPLRENRSRRRFSGMHRSLYKRIRREAGGSARSR